MITLLLVAIVILLGVIAYQAWTISFKQTAMNKWLIHVLSPKEYSFLDDLVGKENPTRSVFDQMASMVAKLDDRIEDLNNKAAYFRNYLWEVQDDRFLVDLKHPPKSVEWNRTFEPPEEPKEYGLWRRERDMSEEFHRDVVVPTTRAKNQPDSS